MEENVIRNEILAFVEKRNVEKWRLYWTKEG
jgi:hypothetical protein